MKSAVAWNVKGVGHDAQETARDAARRAGLSVGEWLNSVIIESAGHGPEAHGQDDDRADEDFSEIRAHLDALAARLGKSASGVKGSAGSRPDDESSLLDLKAWLPGIGEDLARSGEETPQRVIEAIDRLNARLDQLIGSGRMAASEAERRATAIDRALDDLDGEIEHTEAVNRRETGASEAAMREIVARQRTLDRHRLAGGDRPEDEPADVPTHRSGETMTALERQLRALTHQIETMRRPCAFEDAVGALRRDLGNIGDALAKAMPRCTLDALESEVQSLAGRVERGRRRGGDAAGMAAIDQRLTKVHDTLADLTPAENIGGVAAAVDGLSRKIDSLSPGGPDAASMQHLEIAIKELRSVTERVASGEALATLASEVRTLAERIDRLSDPSGRDAISALEQRIEALGELVTARAAEVSEAQSSRLEALINALSVQLEQLDLDKAAIAQIEERLAELTEKVNASDVRLGSMEMIERGLADLFLQIEQTRADATEVAEFKRDLADLRLTQTESDRRTQQTFDLVQNTLEQLRDRLTPIEIDPPAPEPRRNSAPAPEPRRGSAPASEPPRMPPQRSAPEMPLVRPPVGTAASTASAIVAADRSRQAADRPTATPPIGKPKDFLDSPIPADYPLEPGSGTPHGRAASAAERIAASEAALGPIKPGAAPGTGDKANFIAAARRAAQAAAAESMETGRRRADNDAPIAEADEVGEKRSKFRRPFFMGIAALLVVGVTHVALSMVGSSNAPRGDSSRQTASDTARGAGESGNAPAATDTAIATAGNPVAPPAAAPVQGNPLFAPSPVANSAVASAALASPAPATPRPEGKGAAPISPWDVNVVADVTGSLPKPDAAAAGTPAVPAAAADGLPAAIGGPGLRAAATAGNGAAAYEIAMRYAEGRGIPQNFGEAARWLERAAEQGLAPAQYRLGSFYEKGHGVKKDLEAARRLYVAAAEKGNARAMHNLAVLYAEGIDGKQEYKTASQWFRKAALRGLSDSQYNLGILYARGIGVDQNFTESYKWFALAAQQGDQEAGRKRDDVASRLDPQSLVAAKLAAQTFTAESQPEEATTVKPPPGGWEHPAAAAPAAAPAKPKASARRT